MNKNRIKKLVTEATTRAEVELLVNDVALAIVNRRKIEVQINEAKLAIDKKFAAQLSLLDEGMSLRTDKIQAWAEANPDEFKDRKSIDFPSGTIGFRTGTPKVTTLSRKWTLATALEAVKKLLPAYIRTTEEIDRDKIIADRNDKMLQQKLPQAGLKIVQDESFYVTSNIQEADTKQVATVEQKEAA